MAGWLGRRVVAVVVALMVVVGFAPVGSPAGAAGTTAIPAVGAVTDLTWGISRTDMERTVSALSAAGVRWVRLNVSWSGVERDGKGVLNTGWLAEIDAAVRMARAAGLQVLMPISDGVPYWASADPAKSGGSWNKYWKPVSMADYGDFVSFVTRRYSPLGVNHYEIWNEPNHPHFWPSGINAVDYVPMLKAGYQAVKAANPAAVVLMGGLSKGDHYYLQQLYAAGARPYMDVINVHPYTGTVAPTECWTDRNGRKAVDAFCSIEEVRNVMVANGDGAKALWLTELGWSSYAGTWGVTEAQQAQYLTDAYTWLGSRTYVSHAFWYSFRNTYWLNDDPTEWEANAGLLRTNFTTKPAYTALSALTAQAATTTTAPTTTTTTAPPTNTTAPRQRGGTFSDDDGSVHEANIELISAADITRGCAPRQFCPSAVVSRAQLASFLDRALQLPATAADYFQDDEGNVHEAAINRVAAMGVTSGCGPDRFCPDATVSRAQMASLVARGFGIAPAATSAFVDIDGTHFVNIAGLEARRIIRGCSADRFCPDRPVTRDQMATFLAAAMS